MTTRHNLQRTTILAYGLAALLAGSAAPAETNAAEPRVLGAVPDFALTNQGGHKFGTRYLKGKVWVANFIFTTCPNTCPEQSRRMRELQEKLETTRAWEVIRLISFSVDPETDTPDVLRAYAKAYEADPEHWHFLTGSREAIWDLSKTGFKLDGGETPPGGTSPLFHSPKLMVVDAAGRIRGYFDGMTDEGVEAVRVTVQGLVNAAPPIARGRIEPRPTWLNQRAEAQHATTNRFKVFHNFRFVDRQATSGIDFRHRIVDDAGRSYKPAHYDHGNGVIIADVDVDGLPDIYFSNQAGSNRLYRNLGKGRFEDVTGRAGVDDAGRIGVSATFADVDNDGDPDLYVTGLRSPNRLYENDGTGRFTDISASSGLDYAGHPSAAVFFDYNRDGLLDLFLCNVGVFTTDRKRKVADDPTTLLHEAGEFEFYEAFTDSFAGHIKPERTETSRLYRNLGENRFADVTEETGLVDESWNGDAAAADLNGDGWIDIYLANMQGHDQYYQNLNGERFERKSRELFPATPWGSMGVKAFDYDNDGDLDLYVTDMHSDMAADIGPELEKQKNRAAWPASLLRLEGIPSIRGNAFFQNQGDGSFKEISDAIGAENYWPWGFSVGDLNADGYDDVFIASSMNYPFRYGVNSLLLNNEGRQFLDSEFILGIEPRPEEIPWFELDCGGADKSHLNCSGTDQTLTMMSPRGSRSSVIFDLDDDGDLDIVAAEFNTEPLVFVSDLSARKAIHYLKVRLEGTESNRDGLGAKVTVHAGGATYMKVNDGQSGYLSHSLAPLYFGLGDADVVDKIEVAWPSGQKQELAGPIEANRMFSIREPETEIRSRKTDFEQKATKETKL
jgi:cytochrome oxidase Cu insertion factor (SCO1/SenC/PrrC family)